MSKRLLILAEQYYPLQVPSTFRVHSFGKYLPKFGYDCHVIAPAWNAANLRHVSHARQVFEGSESESPCPLTQVDVHPVFTRSRLHEYIWPFREGAAIKDEMVSAANRLFREQSFDAVLATAPAYYPLRAAIQIAQHHNIPAIADLRDVYNEHEGSIQRTSFQKLLHLMKRVLGKQRRAWRELVRMCNSCNATTTVSKPLADLLERRGVTRSEVVLNGFDPDDYNCSETSQSRFRIVYAGTVHQFQRPEPFLDALDMLQGEGRLPATFEVVFHTRPNSIGKYLQGRPCASFIHERPQVSKKEISEVLTSATLLLHFSAKTYAGGILTSKITEYLGAQRPILTVTGDGDVVDAFLAETNSGLSLKDPCAIRDYLAESLKIWEEKKHIPYASNSDARFKYTRESQCMHLASILTSISRPTA